MSFASRKALVVPPFDEKVANVTGQNGVFDVYLPSLEAPPVISDELADLALRLVAIAESGRD